MEVLFRVIRPSGKELEVLNRWRSIVSRDGGHLPEPTVAKELVSLQDSNPNTVYGPIILTER